jgi:hypothetical protein
MARTAPTQRVRIIKDRDQLPSPVLLCSRLKPPHTLQRSYGRMAQSGPRHRHHGSPHTSRRASNLGHRCATTPVRTRVLGQGVLRQAGKHCALRLRLRPPLRRRRQLGSQQRQPLRRGPTSFRQQLRRRQRAHSDARCSSHAQRRRHRSRPLQAACTQSDEGGGSRLLRWYLRSAADSRAIASSTL